MAASAYTILVADDDKDVHEIARGVFSSRGHTVLNASDGAECIELARVHNPDIIVLDMRMPGMDGMAIARRLKANPDTSKIPILGVSGVAHVQAEALEAGCEAFFLKPILPSVLIEKIERMLEFPAQ
jgi:CheY-like chemotaxis protein